MSGNLTGMLAMIGAQTAFVLNDAFVRAATASLPTGEILFIRGAFAWLLLAVAVIALGAARPLGSLLSQPMGWRIFGEVTATALFIWSFVHVDFAEAQTISQLTAIAVMAAAHFLGERVGWRGWLAALVRFACILMIVRPGTEAFSWYSLPLIGSVLLVAVRNLATRRIDPGIATLMLVLLSAIGVCLLGPCACSIRRLGRGWAPLDRLLAAGYVMMTVALRVGDLSAAAPLRYSAMVSGLLPGILVWNKVPDLIASAGMLVVVAAGLQSFHRERKLGHVPPRPSATRKAAARSAMVGAKPRTLRPTGG
jgi:drug/metabolite transporter (DMT)-like permease